MRNAQVVVVLLAGALLTALATPVVAQRTERRFDTPQDTAVTAHGGWSPIRVAKWGTLLGSTGVLAYGFTQNRVADREYERIERLCQNTPDACATKPDSDEYADPALESRYQNVVRRDERARVALLAGQIGLAASVLLFILDLPESTTPDDIPYDPRPVRLGIRAGEVVADVRLQVR